MKRKVATYLVDLLLRDWSEWTQRVSDERADVTAANHPASKPSATSWSNVTTRWENAMWNSAAWTTCYYCISCRKYDDFTSRSFIHFLLQIPRICKFRRIACLSLKFVGFYVFTFPREIRLLLMIRIVLVKILRNFSFNFSVQFG